MKKLAVITPDELKAELGIALGTQANWRSQGKIAYSKVGKKIVYRVEDIQAMIDRHRVNATDAA